jgi:dynactin 1
LTKAKKQEKVYSDAIEQLQAEQDALEAENARLRKGVDPVREALLPAVELALPMGGGLEASQLAEQVCTLRLDSITLMYRLRTCDPLFDT